MIKVSDSEFTAEVVTQSELTTEELVTEIRKRISDTTQNIVEIGQLLIQAKKQVSHGEWEEWLSVNVKFTLRTANRFMQCAERFAKQTTSSGLSSSQMFELLALKSGDTEEFLNQKSSEGKPVESMSIKVLREEVRQWKVAKKNQGDISDGENSQTSDIEVSKEQIKKLRSVFNLSNDLANVDDFDSLIRVYAENDSEKMNSYAETLFKIAQAIKNVINA